MKSLEEAGYRLHSKKCEVLQNEAKCVRHKIDQKGIRPLQDKLEAFTKRNIPKNGKKFSSWGRYNTYQSTMKTYQHTPTYYGNY